MDPVLLAIETSGDSGGACLLRGDNVLAEHLVSAPRRHGAEIMTCVDQCLVKAGLRRQQIDLVAVNAGPGSYTGLRIGLSCAQALGFALDRPVLGVPCFEAMALQMAADKALAGAGVQLWPVLDARRDEVMTAPFVLESGLARRDGDDRLARPADFGQFARPGAVVFGAGIEPYRAAFEATGLRLLEPALALAPASLALAAKRELGSRAPSSLAREPVQPRYFRRVLAQTTEERSARA